LIAILITLNRLGKLGRRQVCAIIRAIFNSIYGVVNPAKMHLSGWLIAILITLNRLGKLCRRQVCAIFCAIIGGTVFGSAIAGAAPPFRGGIT